MFTSYDPIIDRLDKQIEKFTDLYFETHDTKFLDIAGKAQDMLDLALSKAREAR